MNTHGKVPEELPEGRLSDPDAQLWQPMTDG
jgi:hypothetical protein